jgi:transposase
VIKKYFDKDVVEKAYRELKTNINLNPVRKYRMNRVSAHVKICYLAYAILSLMQNKLKDIGITANKALDQIQSVHKVELESTESNIKWSKTVTLKNEQIKILKHLNCSV